MALGHERKRFDLGTVATSIGFHLNRSEAFKQAAL
jgi:hypothetical protein